jgi:Ca-activated chloride channel family protein
MRNLVAATLDARTRRTAAAALALLALLSPAAIAAADAAAGAPAGGAAPLLLVLDASGSMWGQIGGENKVVIARRVVGGVIDGLADDALVGLVGYGHRREGDCADIETLVPVGPLDKAAFKATVEALAPKGKTPITAALEQAFAAVGEAATVVLVSDGLETCGGDPCAAVRAARMANAGLLVHVVGFDVGSEDVSQLECAAQAGGGLFFSAEDAGELSAALEAAVAMPAEAPAGRLAVKAVADGALQDAVVRVVDAASGAEAGGGRTYAETSTNPRLIPLADGRYRVSVRAVGIAGAASHDFEIEIAEGATVEREVDYSTGELAVGVTRNGALSDATVRVVPAGGGDAAAQGRTYTAASSNPKRMRLPAGRYDVEVASVEIAGKPVHRFAGVEVAPQGRAEVSHDFGSGTVSVRVVAGGSLADATVRVVDLATGGGVDQNRTYTDDRSNPTRFVLEPGRYRLEVQAVRGPAVPPVEVDVEAGADAELTVELPP